MIKKKIIIIIFFCLSFNHPSFVYSQSITPTPEETDTNTEIQENDTLFGSIFSFFKSVFGTKDYYAKDVDPSTTNDSQLNTDYTNKKKDTTTRVLPDKTRIFNKGVYLNDIITGNNDYENKEVESDDSSCPNLKPSDVVYYYYKKGEKILYTLDDSQNPIEYNPTLMEDKYKIDLSSPESCYINFYNNLESVPQGAAHKKKDLAAPASKQLNNSLRYVIPASSQGENAPKENSSTDSAKLLVKDNDKQEENMLYNFIPEKSHDQITTSSSTTKTRQNLRQSYAQWLTPQSWR